MGCARHIAWWYEFVVPSVSPLTDDAPTYIIAYIHSRLREAYGGDTEENEALYERQQSGGTNPP